MRRRTIVLGAASACLALAALGAEGRPSQRPAAVPSDQEVQLAASAIEQADGYQAIVAAAERHADVLASPRIVELVDLLLQNPSLNAAQRGMLLLERQLSIDVRQLGAVPAARLLSIRVIAASALSAETPQQLATVLEKFSPLATVMTVPMVRDALAAPANAWPEPLLPLMEQLARDWPAVGASGAANRMAEAANKTPAPTPAPTPNTAPGLPGHWRSTSIVFDNPQDEHLVLHENGGAETWIVTASGKSPVTRGRWIVKATMLSVDWEDGRRWGQPFTFHQGQLVFPNVPNQRQIWEAIR